MSMTYGFKVYTKWLEIIYTLEMVESEAHICKIEQSSSLLTYAKYSVVWPLFLRNITY